MNVLHFVLDLCLYCAWWECTFPRKKNVSRVFHYQSVMDCLKPVCPSKKPLSVSYLSVISRVDDDCMEPRKWHVTQCHLQRLHVNTSDILVLGSQSVPRTLILPCHCTVPFIYLLWWVWVVCVIHSADLVSKSLESVEDDHTIENINCRLRLHLFFK